MNHDYYLQLYRYKLDDPVIYLHYIDSQKHNPIALLGMRFLLHILFVNVASHSIIIFEQRVLSCVGDCSICGRFGLRHVNILKMNGGREYGFYLSNASLHRHKNHKEYVKLWRIHFFPSFDEMATSQKASALSDWMMKLLTKTKKNGWN